MNELVSKLNKEIVSELGLSPNMPDGIDDLKELIRDLIYSYIPDMSFEKLIDFQNDQKQTYKSICEKLRIENENLNHEVDDLRSKMSVLEDQYEKFKSLNENFFTNAREIVEKIRNQADQEVIIKDTKCFDFNDKIIETESDGERHYKEDDFSVAPAVYEHHRPSWFSPLRKEFNQSNVAKKTADNTKNTFFSQIAFWKKVSKMDKTDEEKAIVIDFERRKKITDLLNSSLSNEEKYVKYMLLTPGISKDFLKTLTGAEELGLDANVIITYLEQPNCDFNKEIFEAYVSQVHKGTDYNLKKEFANELIREDWYVQSDIRGKKQTWRFVPMDELNELKNKIDSIASILSDMQPKTSGESDSSDVSTENTQIENQAAQSPLPSEDNLTEEDFLDYDEEEMDEAMEDVYDG